MVVTAQACKFLFSLDSDNPKGVVFCIDSLALRSQQYKWLEQFAEEYQWDNFLWLLSIFSFSLAISWTQILKSVFLGQHGRSPGDAIENIQKIGIELGGLNTTKQTYEEDCNFFHQLVLSSAIVRKHILLLYDPGGFALRLGECGGIPDSRMFIIGLRASRISREEECNTPPMGCHPILCNWAWATRWAVHWRLVPTQHRLHMQSGEHKEGQRMND